MDIWDKQNTELQYERSNHRNWNLVNKVMYHQHHLSSCEGVRHPKAQYSSAKLSDIRFLGGRRWYYMPWSTYQTLLIIVIILIIIDHHHISKRWGDWGAITYMINHSQHSRHLPQSHLLYIKHSSSISNSTYVCGLLDTGQKINKSVGLCSQPVRLQTCAGIR